MFETLSETIIIQKSEADSYILMMKSDSWWLSGHKDFEI